MSESEYSEPTSRPRRSDKARGKQPVVDPVDSDLELLDLHQQEQGNEGGEQERELFDEEAEGEEQANAPAKLKAPAQGLLTSTRFQVPAHPEHLSPFESILLNNQQLLVEAVSGMNTKIDFIISNVADARGRPARTAQAAKGRPSTTASAKASTANKEILAKITTLIETHYDEILLPVLNEHIKNKGKIFVTGSNANQVAASNAYWERLTTKLGEESQEWTEEFEPLSDDTRLSLFLKTCKKQKDAIKAAATEAAPEAGPSSRASRKRKSDSILADQSQATPAPDSGSGSKRRGGGLGSGRAHGLDGTHDDDYNFESEHDEYSDDMSEDEEYGVKEEESVERSLDKGKDLARSAYNVNIGWMVCCILVGFSCISRR